MVAAPVKKGGVNLHHGFTLHQSSNNLSQHSRRAVAFHVMQRDNELLDSSLTFDSKYYLELTRQEVVSGK